MPSTSTSFQLRGGGGGAAAATKPKQLAIDHGLPTCPLTSQELPFCPPIENDASPKFFFERMEHIVHNQVVRYLTSNSEISIRQRDNKQLYSSEKIGLLLPVTFWV